MHIEDIRSRTLPDSTRLPWHPAVMAAEEAVQNVLRRDFGCTSDQARKARVRVEMTYDVRRELRERISPSCSIDFGGKDPMQIMGVSYYVVNQLPEPGWRVVA